MSIATLKLLIDADEAIYKACVGSVREFNWNTEQYETIDGTKSFTEARQKFQFLIDSWTSGVRKAAPAAMGVDAVVIDAQVMCLSPSDRKLYRRAVDHNYKSGRSEKPAHFWELDSWVRDNCDACEMLGLEADDVMGIQATRDTVIVSSDKDMKTVPGWLYNPGQDKLKDISQFDANLWWFTQTLMGDRVDGYTGANRVGPIKAAEILADCKTPLQMWHATVAAFTEVRGKNGALTQTINDAMQNAVLARILRPGDLTHKGVAFYVGNERFEIDHLKERR